MEFISKNPLIFILSGKAQSGKNYVADKIEKYYQSKKCIQISFAYYLKQYAKKISDWDGNEKTKPRDLLQSLGIELIKNKIDKNLLINRVIEDIKIYSNFFDIIIITDARLIDEIEKIKKTFAKVITIRVNKEDNNLTEVQKQHITETALDNYIKYDYIIDNNSLNNLEEKTIKILEALYENSCS